VGTLDKIDEANFCCDVVLDDPAVGGGGGVGVGVGVGVGERLVGLEYEDVCRLAEE